MANDADPAGELLSYGHGICDKVSQGRTFADVMYEVKADFATSDEYQASYLITHTVNRTLPNAHLAIARFGYALPAGVRPPLRDGRST